IPGKGHMSGGVLYRKNTEEVIKLNRAWFEEFSKYPSRKLLPSPDGVNS
ncbi:unnamed protein product, partial [marine sediment metagenome]